MTRARHFRPTSFFFKSRDPPRPMHARVRDAVDVTAPSNPPHFPKPRTTTTDIFAIVVRKTGQLRRRCRVNGITKTGKNGRVATFQEEKRTTRQGRKVPCPRYTGYLEHVKENRKCLALVTGYVKENSFPSLLPSVRVHNNGTCFLKVEAVLKFVQSLVMRV